jgi:hypothetical protein
MTRPPRPPPRPKHTSEYTAKIRLCRGCHNEIHAAVTKCLVCGTDNPPAPASAAAHDFPSKKNP